MHPTVTISAVTNSERASTPIIGVLDPAAGTVMCGDRMVSFTRREFALMQTLIASMGRPVSRAEFLLAGWGDAARRVTPNALAVYISYVRRKLEAEGERRVLHTVRGVGYILVNL